MQTGFKKWDMVIDKPISGLGMPLLKNLRQILWQVWSQAKQNLSNLTYIILYQQSNMTGLLLPVIW